MAETVALADPNTYADIYFRINAPYQWGVGWTCGEETCAAFDEEAVALLQEAGFTVLERAHGHSSSIVHRGAEYLYLHPMDFSGYVVTESIPAIEAVLAKAKTFKLRCTDIIRRVRRYTHEEYVAALERERAAIESKVRFLYTTKRRNLWVRGTYNLDRITGGPATMCRVGVVTDDGTSKMAWGSFGKLELSDFVRSVFDDLLRRGEILKAPNDDLYRTRSPRDP